MTLEENMVQLTTALNRLATATEQLIASGGKAKTASTGTKAGAKTAAEAPKAETKPEPKVETKPEPKVETGDVVYPTVDEVRAAFTPYLKIDDKAELKARKEKLRPLLEHFGVDLVSNIPAENRQEALDFLAAVKAGSTYVFKNGEEGDTGGDDGDSII